MRPNPTQLAPLEALAVFALSVALLFGVGTVVLVHLDLAGFVVGEVCFIAGPAFVFARRRTDSLRAGAALLGFRAPPVRALIGAALLGTSFWFLNQTFAWPIAERYLEGTEVAHKLQQTMLPAGRPLLLSLLVFACFPAICEEVLLRGVVARGLRPAIGVVAAVLASSMLFGLLHVLPAQALVTAIFGIPLGIATLASGSLLPSVLMHFLNNAMTILLAGGALPWLATALVEEPGVASLVAGLASALGLALLLTSSRAPGADSRSS